jgi:hypothetical protein
VLDTSIKVIDRRRTTQDCVVRVGALVRLTFALQAYMTHSSPDKACFLPEVQLTMGDGVPDLERKTTVSALASLFFTHTNHQKISLVKETSSI